MTLLYMFAAVLLLGVIVYVYTSMTDPKEPDPLTDEVVAKVARSGKTRLAIKWYRTIHGGSFEQARRAVIEMTGEAENGQ